MKPSSPPSSSSSSVTAEPAARLPSSSSSAPPPPHLSLQSLQLQAEFLKERQRKFQSHSDVTDSSPYSPLTSPLPDSSPFSPLTSPLTDSSPSSSSSSSSSSPCCDIRQARLSLSSPELLSELRASRARPLRHVPAHNGLTTVFSGQGRRQQQVSGSAPSTKPANQRISH